MLPRRALPLCSLARSISRRAPDDPTLTLSAAVADTGCGVPDKVQVGTASMGWLNLQQLSLVTILHLHSGHASPQLEHYHLPWPRLQVAVEAAAGGQADISRAAEAGLFPAQGCSHALQDNM